jgi:hypothetical protein
VAIEHKRVPAVRASDFAPDRAVSVTPGGRSWCPGMGRPDRRDAVVLAGPQGGQFDHRGRPPAAAQPAVVGQPGQPRHDRAVPGAVPQRRPHQGRAAVGAADHRDRADRQRPGAVQPPPPRAGRPGPGRYPRRWRHSAGVSGPSVAGDRQATHRGAGPQPGIPGSGGDSLRLPARRRSAHDGLRQDDPGVPDGGRHRQPSRDRALRRADAQRLRGRAPRRLRAHHLAVAAVARHREDQLRRVHGPGVPLGSERGALQHHGYRCR